MDDDGPGALAVYGESGAVLTFLQTVMLAIPLGH